jgi:hypothetical protein
MTFWSQAGVLAQPIPRPFRYLLLATLRTAEQHYNHATSLVAARAGLGQFRRQIATTAV